MEEKVQELTQNVTSLGFDLEKLQKNKNIKVDYVHIDGSEREEIDLTSKNKRNFF